jgi:hypothetical protein
MALINPGDWPLDANVVDGTELAARLNRLQQAIVSGNASPTRPPYLTAGSIWSQTGTGSDLTLNFFDGTTDHPVGSVIGGVVKFGGATFNTGVALPSTAAKGDLFYNTSTEDLEIYDGGAWKKSKKDVVLQVITATDVGATITGTTRSSMNKSNIPITPKSTSSRLIVEVSFSGYVQAGGAGTNTTGTFEIVDAANTSAYLTGHVLGIGNGAGLNAQIYSPVYMMGYIFNSTLTTKLFSLYGTGTLAGISISATGMSWKITEVA